MDSLMFLAKLCPSLPIIWKLLWLVGWPVWLLWWWMAEGAFRCSLYLSPKVLKVSPMFPLVKQRQLNKLNNLLNKKEGNIIRANCPKLASQAGSSSPWGRKQLRGTSHSVRQAGRCSPSPLGRKQFILGRQSSSYFPSRCSPSLWGREQFISGRQSGSYFPGRHSSSPWGSKQFISGRHSPSSRERKQFISGRQSGKHSPCPWERKYCISGRQSVSHFPGRCSSSLWGS